MLEENAGELAHLQQGQRRRASTPELLPYLSAIPVPSPINLRPPSTMRLHFARLWPFMSCTGHQSLGGLWFLCLPLDGSCDPKMHTLVGQAVGG